MAWKALLFSPPERMGRVGDQKRGYLAWLEAKKRWSAVISLTQIFRCESSKWNRLPIKQENFCSILEAETLVDIKDGKNSSLCIYVSPGSSNLHIISLLSKTHLQASCRFKLFTCTTFLTISYANSNWYLLSFLVSSSASAKTIF